MAVELAVVDEAGAGRQQQTGVHHDVRSASLYSCARQELTGKPRQTIRLTGTGAKGHAAGRQLVGETIDEPGTTFEQIETGRPLEGEEIVEAQGETARILVRDRRGWSERRTGHELHDRLDALIKSAGERLPWPAPGHGRQADTAGRRAGAPGKQGIIDAAGSVHLVEISTRQEIEPP